VIVVELDNELGGLILKHKEINKSALTLKNENLENVVY